MKKTIIMLAALLLVVGMFTSCKDDDNDKPNSYDASNVFTSGYEEYGVGKEQQTMEFNFKSSCAKVLEIVNNNKWLDVSIDIRNSAIIATVTENTGEYARSAEITIQTKDKMHSKTIKIIQEGATGFCTDGKHPHAIDLGTSVKWACCNVGASAPWEYGDYFAWGETEAKDNYDWSTYIHCDGSLESSHKIGYDIDGTEYDVAHVKWGGKWKMPNNNQLDLLETKCKYVWTSLNGVEVGKFTGPNGISIFLPAAGYRWFNSTDYDGDSGYYWSSTESPYRSVHAYDFTFDSGNTEWNGSYRNYGLSVRPVTEQ